MMTFGLSVNQSGEPTDELQVEKEGNFYFLFQFHFHDNSYSHSKQSHKWSNRFRE